MDKKISFILYNFIKKKRNIYNFFKKFTNISLIIFFIIYAFLCMYLLINFNVKLKPFLLSTIILIIVNNIIKHIFKRKRPFLKSKSYSFPSNHASISMVIAISCLYINYILGLILILVSLIISIGRVFIGAHYLSDILFGVLISILISLICFNSNFVIF